MIHINLQLLPKEPLYAPPLNIRLINKKSFLGSPLVGTHVVKSLKPFLVEPKPSKTHQLAVDTAHKVSTPTASSYFEGVSSKFAKNVKDILGVSLFVGVVCTYDTHTLFAPFSLIHLLHVLQLHSDPDDQEQIEFDWWSKYYYSIGDERRTQPQYQEKGYDKMKVATYIPV